MSRLQITVERSLLFAIKRAAMREDLYMRDYIVEVLAKATGWKHEESDEEAARGVAESLRAWGSRRVGNPGVGGTAPANGDGVREEADGATAGAGAVPRKTGRVKKLAEIQAGKLTVDEFMKLEGSDKLRAMREGRYP